MYCTNCGNFLPDDAVFCTACGEKTGRRAVHDGNIIDDISRKYSANTAYRPKSRILAGILAIVLGSLGIHNFYLGYTKKGMIQFFLGIFSLGSVSEIWALADAFMIFTGKIYTDGQGNLLGE